MLRVQNRPFADRRTPPSGWSGVNPKQATATGRGATPEEIREAEKGFKMMLRRKFSAVWIEENAADLLAQANVEYAEWLTENPPARNSVGWLLNCANWRAINRLAEQGRRPTSTSLDAVLHLADESTPTPEHQALDHDRRERLKAAIGVLPKKEQKLLALVYFRDLSIREAGRKLGWQKSAADRHHKAAMDKLRALVGDRSLLSPGWVGVAAWALTYGDRHRLAATIDAALMPGREVLAIGLEGAEWIGNQLAELGRRLAPAAEQANAAASSGGGRLAGACAGTALTVVCALAASGPAPVSVGGAAIERAVPAAGPLPSLAGPAVTPAEFVTEPTAPVAKPAAADDTDATSTPTTTTRTPKRSAKPKATPQDVRSEFEVGASSEGSAPITEPEPAPSTSTGSGSSGGSSSGSSGGSAPTAPSSEFGL
jgi:RNA polymerase sigma factor (sigma-70 family)